MTKKFWNGISILKLFINLLMLCSTFKFVFIKKEVCCIKDIDCGFKWLIKGKAKDIKGYHVEILKLENLFVSTHSLI